MPVGSKWEIVCPPEIAYGHRQMGSSIPADSVLVFTMELLSCSGVQDSAQTLTRAADMPSAVLRPAPAWSDYWLEIVVVGAAALACCTCLLNNLLKGKRH